MIQADWELQNWMADVKENGFAFATSPVQGHFETKAQLEHLLAGIIYAASVLHSLVGNPSFDIFGNPGNHPFALRKPPPTKV